MAIRYPQPPQKDSKHSKVLSAKTVPTQKLTGKNSGQTFPRLTVVWVQSSGVPFDTTGFFARIYRGSVLVDTNDFDRFGVVRFNRIRTLTNVAYTLRVFSDNGVLFRTRTIPAGVQTFAIIG